MALPLEELIAERRTALRAGDAVGARRVFEPRAERDAPVLNRPI